MTADLDAGFDANLALRTIGARFVIGDRVRHVAQDGGKPGVVTAVTIVPGSIRYTVAFSPTCAEQGCDAIELESAEDEL